MKKFYEKSELWFSITWIIIYVAIMGNLRNNFGDESIFSLLGVLIIAAILTIFILKNDLKIKNTCRASFYFYNTKEEIDKLVEALSNPNIKNELIY